MFATLLGALPRPSDANGPVEPIDEAITIAVAAQEAAGLEPITDGRLRDPGFARLAALLVDDPRAAAADVVAGWASTARHTERAVKQALPGPYSLARLRRGGGANGTEASDRAPGTERAAETLALARGLRGVVAALGDAGCPLVEIEESEAHGVGGDESERALFREAHRLLTEAIEGTHLSLSIVGASAQVAGVETILAAPYASLAVDLIAGPDSWHVVRAAGGELGVIAGALSASVPPEAKEVLLWAAHYAASSRGRGLARVGLGSAGSWANLTWESALDRMQRLGEAARLAALPPGEELASSVDPRALDARTAAVGRRPPAGR